MNKYRSTNPYLKDFGGCASFIKTEDNFYWTASTPPQEKTVDAACKILFEKGWTYSEINSLLNGKLKKREQND